MEQKKLKYLLEIQNKIAAINLFVLVEYKQNINIDIRNHLKFYVYLVWYWLQENIKEISIENRGLVCANISFQLLTV